jgi:hypothetical protein
MGFLSGLFGGKAPKIPAPTDIFAQGRRGAPSVSQQQLTGVEGYYGQALPMFLGLQGQYTPQFMQQGFDFGGQALTGLFGLQREAGTEAAQQMADLRAQELGTMTGQTGLFRTLAGALSPEQQRIVEMEAAEAERATQAARGLTPEEQRGAEQRARESFGARGMLGSTGSVATEVLNRENVLAAKRAEAAGARGRSFEAASSFYTQPGLRMLGATPASYEAGTRLGLTGLELGQSLGPQLDYNLPLNLARERAGALDARNLAQYQADMQAKQARAGMIGNLIGIAAAPFTGGLSLGLSGLGSMIGGGGGSGMMSGMSPAGMVNYRYV